MMCLQDGTHTQLLCDGCLNLQSCKPVGGTTNMHYVLDVSARTAPLLSTTSHCSATLSLLLLQPMRVWRAHSTQRRPNPNLRSLFLPLSLLTLIHPLVEPHNGPVPIASVVPRPLLLQPHYFQHPTPLPRSL